MDLRELIKAELTELFEEDLLPVPEFNDSMVLLDTDLDSLGYAVLVTRLEERIGYDPFSLMEEPEYPVTYGDLVAVYRRFIDHATVELK